MDHIIRELDKIDNKDEKCLFVLGNEYSVNEIIQHLKDNSEIGKEFSEMHRKLQEKMGKIKLPE